MESRRDTVKLKVQYDAPRSNEDTVYSNYSQISRQGTQVEIDFCHIPAVNYNRAVAEAKALRKERDAASTEGGAAAEASPPTIEPIFLTRVILSVEAFIQLRDGLALIARGLASPTWIADLTADLQRQPRAENTSDEDE